VLHGTEKCHGQCPVRRACVCQGSSPLDGRHENDHLHFWETCFEIMAKARWVGPFLWPNCCWSFAVSKGPRGLACIPVANNDSWELTTLTGTMTNNVPIPQNYWPLPNRRSSLETLCQLRKLSISTLIGGIASRCRPFGPARPTRLVLITVSLCYEFF